MLSAPGMTDGGALPMAQVFNGFGCAGANRSPALAWTAPPRGTQSLAVSMFDPDASGKGWWHWTVFNLPISTRALSPGEGASRGHPLPVGARQGRSSYGSLGYGGACPPAGAPPHHYVITVWALDTPYLPFAAGTADGSIGAALRQHAMAQAVMTVRYGR